MFDKSMATLWVAVGFILLSAIAFWFDKNSAGIVLAWAAGVSAFCRVSCWVLTIDWED